MQANSQPQPVMANQPQMMMMMNTGMMGGMPQPGFMGAPQNRPQMGMMLPQ